MNTAIEKFYRDGKKASEIFKLLKRFVSRSGVFKAVKRFNKTGSTQPRVRSTPERPSKTKNL